MDQASSQGGDCNLSPAEACDWSPAAGLVRGGLWGIAATVVLIGSSCLVTWLTPGAFLNWLIRVFFSLVITWTLTAIIQRASGMVGRSVSALGVFLALLTLLSHHLIWALFGIHDRHGNLIVGWTWLDPLCILTVTGYPLLIGGGVAAWLCRDGAVFGDLVGIFSSRLNG